MPCQARSARASTCGSTGSMVLAEPGQRSPPHRPEHLRIAPLALGAAGPELALEHPAPARQPVQRALGHVAREAEPRRQLRRGERRVAAGVAKDQVVERVRHRREQRLRHAVRERGAEPVAVARRVLDRDEPRLAGHPHLQRPPLRHQRSRLAATSGVALRRSTSARPRSPSRSSRSCRLSGLRARAPSQVLQLASTSSTTSASRTSRSSASPSSSRSWSWSIESAWARRSASGASPS